MVTLDDIQKVLMDPSDIGTKAIGRALVLLFNSKNTQYTDPIGLAMSRYYIQYNTLTAKQLSFWRTPEKDGTPKIFKYADDLLQIAIEKEKRRLSRYYNMSSDVIDLINKRNDLMDITLDLLDKSEPGLLHQALFALRKFERQHGMPPLASNIPLELDQVIQSELTQSMNPRKYLSQSNGT